MEQGKPVSNLPPSQQETVRLSEISLQQAVAPQVRERRRRRHRRSGPLRPVRKAIRRIGRLNWLVLVIATLAFGAAIIMGALVLVINAQNDITASWSGLSRDWQKLGRTPMTELTLDDFDRLQTRVRDLNASLAGANSKTTFLRPVRAFNADLDTSLQALAAAQYLGLAANDILSGIRPTIFFLAGGQDAEELAPQFSSGARLVELTNLGRNRFRSAEARLQAAEAIIQRISLAEVSPDVLTTFDGLAQYHAQLTRINAILLDAPTLLDQALGVSQPRTYLVLSQNSDELRPSGGYISTYGWLQVASGRVIRYDYYPTSPTSPNPPDDSLANAIDVPSWWIRYSQPVYAAWDASWTPDFPTTAQMAAWFYEEGHNPQAPVDGVIAVDMVGFEYILEALGEVVVPGYNQTVIPQNFREQIYEIRAEGEGDVPHKRFLAALYKQIFTNWQQVDQTRSADLRRAVLRALQEKHIMIYMEDQALNEALRVLGWGGELKAHTGQDFVLVADANLGSKSNRSVIRQLTYDVTIQPDGSLSSRLAVNYEFFARVAEQDPAVRPAHYNNINYHNLLQIFTAAGSQLSGMTGFPQPPQQVSAETYTEFVAYAGVDYDSSARYQVSYTTPVLVEQIGPYRRYKLTVQKQPGTRQDVISVQVALPPGASVVKVSPAASATFEVDSLILEFRQQLVTDATIEIVYRQ